MEKYFFNCQGSSAPAYSCDKPNANSGHYYKAADVDAELAELQQERGELEASLNHAGKEASRWREMHSKLIENIANVEAASTKPKGVVMSLAELQAKAVEDAAAACRC